MLEVSMARQVEANGVGFRVEYECAFLTQLLSKSLCGVSSSPRASTCMMHNTDDLETCDQQFNPETPNHTYSLQCRVLLLRFLSHAILTYEAGCSNPYHHHVPSFIL